MRPSTVTTTAVTPQILVVEDEPKLRASVAEGLELEKFSVSTAATGLEALREIEAGHFDLLVLDWMLPDFDGVELLKRIRARGVLTPVLMITARVTHCDQIAAFQNGATDFLAKPFAFGELLARCQRLLGPDRAARGSPATHANASGPTRWP